MIHPINLFDGIGQAELPSDIDIDGFCQYLDEVWQSRPLLLQEDDDEDERRSTKQRFFIIEDNSIKARNYTGFVQYGTLRINVYPRVFAGQLNFNASLALEHLIKWLGYSSRIHFPFTQLQTGFSDCNDWLEAFIFLYASFTSDALITSPHFAYEEVTEEMTFVRGRIAMTQYIKNNLASGRQHLLYCTYEPFVYDNLFNRIVKYTSRLLLQCTTERRNKELLENILFSLDDVTDTHCTVADCDKVKINRLYPETDNIRNMCRLFLLFQQTDASSYQDNNLCLMLPMEVIFEEYIAGFIKSNFPEVNAISQASDEYLAINEKDNRLFRMKHDILIPNLLIIDTKYKFRLYVDEKKGVSQNDLYQMVAYCYKRKMTRGMLLYPDPAGVQSEMNDILKVDDLIIWIKSFDLTEVDFKSFDDLQKEKFKNLLATVVVSKTS